MNDAEVFVAHDEKLDVFAEKLDGERNLSEHAPGDYHIDFLLLWPDGATLTCERKDWDKDWVPSFHDGSLSRQASYVDCLIVEQSPFFDPANSRYDESIHEAAEKRFWHYQSQMWAMKTTGPMDTIKRLRYFASKHPDELEIRQNLVVPDEPTKREQIIAVFDYVNTRRALDENDGVMTVGDRIIEDIVSWEDVVAAFNLPEWKSIEGIGDGIVNGVREALLEDDDG